MHIDTTPYTLDEVVDQVVDLVETARLTARCDFETGRSWYRGSTLSSPGASTHRARSRARPRRTSRTRWPSNVGSRPLPRLPAASTSETAPSSPLTSDPGLH